MVLMSNSEVVGFEYENGIYREYLPCSNQITTKEQKRSLFLSMFNFYMCEDLQFKKEEFDFKKPLLENFNDKVKSLLPASFIYKVEAVKAFKLDVVSTIVINNFLSVSSMKKAKFLMKHHKLNRRVLSKTPSLVVAKWIELFHKNPQAQMLFYLNDMFSSLIYERIKKVNKGKKVTNLKDGISIIGYNGDETSIFVVPSFCTFDINKIHSSKQVDIAKEELR